MRKFEEEEGEHEKHPAKPKADAPRTEVPREPPIATPIVDEVVNETAAEPDSEVDTKEPQPLPVKPVTEPRMATPADLGKGGYQHRIVQERIKAAAQKKGFRATLEKAVMDGKESVDVALERSGLRIACEISVTTTVDHEVGNVRKCQRAGFDVIAVITASERRLTQIEEAVKGHLSADEAGRVQYFTPDQFLEFIESLPDSEPEMPGAPVPSESVKRGYKVKRKFAPLTSEERDQRNDSAFKLLAEEMRLPPPT